ncbi:MAG: hypothetical protein Q8Q89_01175 [bacterium]|nr:hypothetical protein [bacterium]
MPAILKNNQWLFVLVAVFIFTRFFGLDQFYHQDEYRWISIINTAEFGELDSPHPPVMETFLSIGGKLVGYDNLRVVPFVFSIFNLLLVYAVSLKLTGNKKIAYLAAGLFVVNIYSLIANLMIDIDGSFLPFVVLLTYYFYLRTVADGNKKLILPLILIMIVGFMTKLSFVIFVGALAVEYLWELYEEGKFKNKIKKAGFILSAVIMLAVGIYMIYGAIDPYFITYSTHFKIFDFTSRAYFDLFLRLFKFFIWLSPLLFLPMIYGLFKEDIFKKYRIWYIYSLFNFLFYLVIFNFATLPIERYFMFIIVPSVLISAHVIYSFLSKLNKKYLIFGALGFLILLVFTLFINYDIVPLNPKEAYLDKVKSLDLNFLIPLTGGSGPIGFYGSAQFILWTWIVCVFGFFLNKKRLGIVLFLVFGVGYNILLSSEHLTGLLYGSVNNITKRSVGYVINNQEIDGVITYYDAGVYYLKLKNKYVSRFYTAPKRDYTKKLTEYRGHYMIVDFPAIDKKSEYWKLISKCNLDKKLTDKYVDSYIFDCRALP